MRCLHWAYSWPSDRKGGAMIKQCIGTLAGASMMLAFAGGYAIGQSQVVTELDS